MWVAFNQKKTFFLFFFFSLGFVACSSYWQKDSNRKLASSGMILDKSGYLYDPEDTSCDGFPMLQVQTMPGTCLGMVMPRSRANDPETDRSFIKPRTIVQIPNTEDFFVIDMGGWKANNGRLFLLSRFGEGDYKLKLVKFGLDTPHGLRLAPDGYFYIGEKDRIVRFHFINNQIQDWEIVISGLPSYEGHMHPLTQFAFNPNNMDLYINSGAPSDHCYSDKDKDGEMDYRSCPETVSQGLGAIYQVKGKFLKDIPEGGLRYYSVLAQGLRNSMAMHVHPSGNLIQGENARDFPEFEEPYEEINMIDANNDLQIIHYGWPYCYNFFATSPEWLFAEENVEPGMRKRFQKPVNCSASANKEEADFYQEPYVLMPPHVAPLHLDYYQGEMFPELKGNLLVSWHGHQPTGNRLVAYPTDAKGLPLLSDNVEAATFFVDNPPGCPIKQKFSPRGGLKQFAPYKEIISGWYAIPGKRPEGAPVAFTEASDGSIWIVEDRKNRVVVRLARTDGPQYQDNCDISGEEIVDPKVKLLAWRNYLMENPEQKEQYQRLQAKLTKPYCYGCHGDLQSKDIDTSEWSELDFLVKQEWISPGKVEDSKLYQAIVRGEGYTPMPPLDKPQFFGTEKANELFMLTKNWIESMDSAAIQAIFAKSVMERTRNIRNLPTTSDSKTCGQMQAADVVYVDPRKDKIVSSDGWDWARIYLLPSHTRLFADKCDYPENGVFYIAIRKTGQAKSVIPAIK